MFAQASNYNLGNNAYQVCILIILVNAKQLNHTSEIQLIQKNLQFLPI